MKIRNLVYLAQIEEYDSQRVFDWLKNNPKKEVIELKKKLILTPKTIAILFLTHIFSLLFKPEKSIYLALKSLYPIDYLLKFILVSLAKLKIHILHPKLITIGITGSWGKTTTKEILWNIFNHKYITEKTLDNQNTLIGVSLRILKMPINTEVFVCEMGAYQAGDIKRLCQLTRPKISIITTIGPMHLERFGTIQNIIKTKFEIIDTLPNNGYGFIPRLLKKHLKRKNLSKKIFYFDSISNIYFEIGKIFKINSNIIKKVIKDPPIVKHRHQVIDNGIVKLIDNSYNSNPASFRKSVDILYQQKTKIRIIITPGMVELGQLSSKENYQAALYASKKCTHAIIVGKTNKKALTKGFQRLAKNRIHFVKSFKEVDEILQEIIIPKNTSILIENDLPDNYF